MHVSPWIKGAYDVLHHLRDAVVSKFRDGTKQMLLSEGKVSKTTTQYLFPVLVCYYEKPSLIFGPSLTRTNNYINMTF